MSWLSDWLKSIIMVILLATFVDILLPNQTMQRYVKTVISLFILLTLLQPLFSLFQKSVSVDQMLGKAQALFQDHSASGTALPAFQASSASSQAGGPGQGSTWPQAQSQGASGGMQTLGSIQQQAEELKMQQEEKSRRLMQQQIISLMKQNIEQTPAYKVSDIKLETGKDLNGHMQIRSIRVLVAYRPLSNVPKGQSQTVGAFQVEPVKPVDITIEAGSGQSGGTLGGGGIRAADREAVSVSRSTPSGADQMKTSAGFEQQQSQIRMLLSKAWQVPEDRIDVEVTGEKL